MAIQFVCPSCSVLIEVEDEWANQSVACGNCQKIVTAPAETTWAEKEVRTAHPSQSPSQSSSQPHAAFGTTPPPPPSQFSDRSSSRLQAQMPYRDTMAHGGQQSSVMTFTSLGLVALTFLFGLVALISLVMIVTQVIDQNGPGLTAPQDQIDQFMQKTLEEGGFPDAPIALTFCIAAVATAAVAIILSIIALARGEKRRVLAVVSMVIGAMFLLAGVMLLLTVVVMSRGVV